MSDIPPSGAEPDIPQFDRHFFDGQQQFTRIGTGSIGGKAKGLASIHSALRAHFDEHPIPGVTVNIPTLTVIATDVFEQFIKDNDLYDVAHSDMRDDEIALEFQQADLPVQVLGDLRALITQVKTPLAIRSSSYLEDAMYQPFASVYTTKMIPNNQSDANKRFNRLIEAIKFTYASTYFRNAKNYIRATEYTTDDERMAVIIQESVGLRHADRHYPHISGVARSFNFYPMGHATPEDGVVDLALGLGKVIVDEGQSWTYSPAYPRANPPYNSPSDLVNQTQNQFWAVNMGPPPPYDPIRDTEYLSRFSLSDAEMDGVLRHLASTYDPQDDRIEIGAGSPGPRILTFAPILNTEVVPLNQVVKDVLKLSEDHLGHPVEIEFALTLNPQRAVPARFGFLQVRPMVVSTDPVDIHPSELEGEDVLVASESVLGNGEVEKIRDIIFVKPEAFSAMQTRRIAYEIEQFNRGLLTRKRPYLLIGFGRWGSSDPSLGIPVNFGQISGAKVIVETTLPELMVTLSQGSHFFHNITSFRILYFSIPYTDPRKIDWEWLLAQEAAHETEYVSWVELDSPLTVRVDGRTGRGVIRR
ncbi:MAG: hypothetical protein GF341_06565 [candidate division Zixibacteria bacterium]|nr:hypothetical protein [candidate division Zixibacteria bacterium]